MGVDRTFDYVPSLEADLAATKAKLAASDLERIRLRAALRESCEFIGELTQTLTALYTTIEDAAAMLPEVRAEMAAVRAQVDAWKAMVQP